MKIFLTGATGYIGGAVGARLLAKGHSVTALCRSESKVSTLEESGYDVIQAGLADIAPFVGTLSQYDAILNCADSDDPYFISTAVTEFAGSGKTIIHTSGSSIVGDKAAGAYEGRIHQDLSFPRTLPEKAGRIAIDDFVIRSADVGIRTAVICPCMIYGLGSGAHQHSIQIPLLIDLANKYNSCRHIGEGRNIWSNIHIDDLVSLFELVLDETSSGVFYFAENGENSLRDICTSINRASGISHSPDSWTVEEAIREWNAEAAHFAFGSNSRVRSTTARKVLGWDPINDSLISDIESGYYGLINAS